MTAIQFYHLTTTPLEVALPKLLEKAYSANMRACVLTANEERAEYWNQLLWTYGRGSFLPHGGPQDDRRQDQPILIATEEPADFASALLMVTDGRYLDNPSCERVFDLFDGSDPQSVSEARNRWSQYKQAGHTLNYLKQNERGGWDKPAQ